MVPNPRLALTLPDRAGARYLITGATSGIGYFVAEALATTGAQVLIGARDVGRGRVAAESITRLVPRAKVEIIPLDLSNRHSVQAAVDLVGGDRLDGLVLNAGLKVPASSRQSTAAGNELTLETNAIGHAALATGLLPALTLAAELPVNPKTNREPGPRVVGVGSLATVVVPLDAQDLQSERHYRPFRAYGLSKHLLHGFVFELDRRLLAAHNPVRAVLADPGYSVDALSPSRPGIVVPGPFERLPFAQGKHAGAYPLLRALLDPGVVGGEMFAPRWTMFGSPVRARPVESSRSPVFGRAVWPQLQRWSGSSLRV